MSPWDAATLNRMKGSQGFIGHGYSEFTVEYPPLPDGPPPTVLPDEEEEVIVPWSPNYRFRAYVGTWGLGVYYCNNIEGPDGSQATWTQVNSGLGSYVYGIRVELDPFDRYYRQYFLANDADEGVCYGTLFMRENQGSWSTILTEAQAKSTIGAPSNTYITDFCPDAANDQRIYAAVYDAYNENVYVIKTDNRGSSWSSVKNVANVTYENEYWPIASIQVYDEQIVVITTEYDAWESFYWFSSNYGSTFTQSIDLQSHPAYWSPCYFNGYQKTPYFRAYDDAASSPHVTLCRKSGATGLEQVIDYGLYANYCWYDSQEMVWGSDQEEGWYSANDHNSDELLISSNDWDSHYVVDVAPEDVNLHFRNPYYVEDFVFGQWGPNATYPHAVYVSDDRGETLVGRAGPMPGTSPYTNSIPRTAGICWGGFKVWVTEIA